MILDEVKKYFDMVEYDELRALYEDDFQFEDSFDDLGLSEAIALDDYMEGDLYDETQFEEDKLADFRSGCFNHVKTLKASLTLSPRYFVLKEIFLKTSFLVSSIGFKRP